MNGELAQLVALVSHATAWLGGDDGALVAVAPESQPFRWVSATTFVSPDGRADSEAAGWCAGLRERGVDRLRLVVPAPGAQTSGGLTVDDRLLAGFANAGRHWALATGSGRPEAWAGEWALGDREQPDRRIWSVAYRGQPVDGEPDVLGPTVVDAAAALDAALEAAADFAGSVPYLDSWVEVFDAARVAGPNPELVLLPASYPADAQVLAARAAAAWVFGGMGSWNDIGFDDDEERSRYDAVSAALYVAVLVATTAATNAMPGP